MVNDFNLGDRHAGMNRGGKRGEVVQTGRFGAVPPAKSEPLCSAASQIFRAALPPPQSALEAAAGHAVPTRRVLSARRVILVDRPAATRCVTQARRLRRSFFSSGPCAKPPGWSRRQASTLSTLGRSHRGAIGKAGSSEAIERTHALLGLPARLPARHRPRLRHRRDGDGDLVAARPAAGDDAGVGELRRGLGDRCRQATQARRRYPHRRLWRDRGSSPTSIRHRTSSSPGTARPAACAFPMPTGSRPIATGLAICDATSAAFAQAHRLGEDRCRHLQLAKGARRRSGAWHAGAQPARGRTARDANRRLARCPRFSASPKAAS